MHHLCLLVFISASIQHAACPNVMSVVLQLLQQQCWQASIKSGQHFGLGWLPQLRHNQSPDSINVLLLFVARMVCSDCRKQFVQCICQPQQPHEGLVSSERDLMLQCLYLMH